jgi:hypothetical protein
MRGIFYNSKRGLCSIWESGKMCYDALVSSGIFSLDYSEDENIDTSYDFLVLNHHFTVNNWITETDICLFNKPTFCVVTEIAFGENPIENVPSFFHHYIVLDPTVTETHRIHAFSRPLEDFDIYNHPYIPKEIPRIGSFGLATFGKDWHKIVECVQIEFDKADIIFNIPKGTHVPEYMHQTNISTIKQKCDLILKKPNISLTITQDNFTKEELLNFCAQNTINCFFYDREHLFTSGLAAVTDQAIASGRPLLITKDATFRHIHSYLDSYPTLSMKKCIETTTPIVLKMKDDWSAARFLNKFENILFSV